MKMRTLIFGVVLVLSYAVANEATKTASESSKSL
jgi:hypothetical protein